MSQREHHRTVWLSDVHLGSRSCRVGLLLDFLTRTRCDVLYLVGDIVDLRSLRRSFFWPRSHTDALQQILAIAREGTRVVYIPGNHDDDFRALAGTRFAGIEIERQCVQPIVGQLGERGAEFLQRVHGLLGLRLAWPLVERVRTGVRGDRHGVGDASL